MLPSSQGQQHPDSNPPNTTSSPTPSLDSLNGMAVSMLGAAAGAAVGTSNGDQHSDNGSHSESSSGLGSLAANAVINGGAGATTNPNGVATASSASVMTNPVHGNGGHVDRSASTSSAGSLCSSGLGSSPLGGATLPLFGNGTASTNGNAPIVVNGNANNLSPPVVVSGSENGLAAAAAATPSTTGSSPTTMGILPKCSLCCASFTRPKVLHSCFHIFCQSCLENIQDHPDKITCPTCRCETSLNHGGISGLMSDGGMLNYLLNGNHNGSSLAVGGGVSVKDFQTQSTNYMQCTMVGCREIAISKCMTCQANLCSTCVNPHLYNNRYDNNHQICTVGEYINKKENGGSLQDVRDISDLTHMVMEAKLKMNEVRSTQKIVENSAIDQYNKARSDVNEAFHFYTNLLEERKAELMRDLDTLYNNKRMVIKTYHQKHQQESLEKIYQVTEFAERLFRTNSNNEVKIFRPLIEQRLLSSTLTVDATNSLSPETVRDFAFVPNYHSIQAFIRSSVGYIRNNQQPQRTEVETAARAASVTAVGGPVSKQPPISRPSGKMSTHSNEGLVLSSLMSGGEHHAHHHSGGSSNSSNGSNAISNGLVQGIANLQANNHTHPSSSSVVNGINTTIGDIHTSTTSTNILANGINGLHLSQNGSNGAEARMLQMDQQRQHYSTSPFDMLTKRMNGGANAASLNTMLNGSAEYDKWSNGSNASSVDTLASKLHHHQQQQQQQHLFNDENLAAAVASYKAMNGASNGACAMNGAINSAMNGACAMNGAINGACAMNGASNGHHDPMMDLPLQHLPSSSASSLSGSGGLYATPKSQIKRQKMIYHCKFGEFGVLEGQFTEPSGVAVNAQNDIIVADTNNHRIQIFDKDGRFKFQFGECGKRDGQLLYPNRVAAVRSSGDIIVTERSPTHQVQIYNQYGQFVRKFGANILQHPRGVCVDNHGRIIVVECKVMRVIIFDQMGTVLNKFGCSKHLEFPNGVVVNDRREIFISDNRAHCVKVFNYEGQYLRQIGGEGLTNYPIGVGINAAGEVTIADNHNNFNLSVFSQDGKLLSALESKVKHAQCFDVALMDDGSVVLASKDYRLYIYRYVQLPPIGM